MDQIVEARVPSIEQEAVRDLLRAREDTRSDLMRCRHRLSKLLLRHGIVYSGDQAWTGVHETWLRGQGFARRGVQFAFDAPCDLVHTDVKKLDNAPSAAVTVSQDGEQSTTLLGEWYATALLWKPQVALLVNETTLLPTLIPPNPADLDRPADR